MAAVSPWRPVATLAPMILRMPCSSPLLGTPVACRLNRVAKPGFGPATLTTGASTGGPTAPRAERRERLRGGGQPGRDLVTAASVKHHSRTSARTSSGRDISSRNFSPQLRHGCTFALGLLQDGLVGGELIRLWLDRVAITHLFSVAPEGHAAELARCIDQRSYPPQRRTGPRWRPPTEPRPTISLEAWTITATSEIAGLRRAPRPRVEAPGRAREIAHAAPNAARGDDVVLGAASQQLSQGASPIGAGVRPLTGH
jgi:hypothetical protein